MKTTMLGRFRVALAILGSAALWLAATPLAMAIVLENPGSIIVQQVNDHPCLFGGNSCNNPAGFGYTLLSNTPPGDTYNADSPTYTVGQIRDVLKLTDPLNYNSFFVGIDVNTTKAASETLQQFAMYVGGVLVQQFSAAPPGDPLTSVNNGTGFSDALLKTFELTGYADGASVMFHLIENGAVDGSEEYFLVNAANPQPVPEPSTLLLMAVAAIGLSLLGHRHRRGRHREA